MKSKKWKKNSPGKPPSKNYVYIKYRAGGIKLEYLSKDWVSEKRCLKPTSMAVQFVWKEANKGQLLLLSCKRRRNGTWMTFACHSYFPKQEVSREAKKPQNITKKQWLESLNLGKQACGKVFRTRCSCIVLVLTSSGKKIHDNFPTWDTLPASHPKGAMLFQAG